MDLIFLLKVSPIPVVEADEKAQELDTERSVYTSAYTDCAPPGYIERQAPCAWVDTTGDGQFSVFSTAEQSKFHDIPPIVSLFSHR